MKILLLHNRYLQRGGEDVCVDAHQRILQTRGHHVRLMEADNSVISGRLAEAMTAINAVYARKWKQLLAAEMAAFHPDVVHIHNTFPLLSPAVIMGCKEASVPVVHTFHNYRLCCPAGLLFRCGRVCEACLGRRFSWPGVLYGCYRGSRAATTAVSVAYGVHRWLHTYSCHLDAAIALTQFAKSKLVRAGIPSAKVVVIPNWLEPDPGVGSGEGGYFLFVGRISEEKGVRTLLRAWDSLHSRAPLLIAGTGPLQGSLRASSPPGVIWLLQQTPDEVIRLMQQATALILPSECFENFPRTAVEAFSVGTPIIASRLGSLQEIVEDRATGLHFSPGDSGELAEAATWLLDHPSSRREMRAAARAQYEHRYSADRVFPMLLQAYHRAVQHP
jgi:glycosyltransferase involved in cell wall biosynthesis